MAQPLSQSNSLVFSHMGIYVRDLERMARFYKDVMCFFETDRGDLGPVQLVFLSRDPSEHHQIVLATGRPADLSFSVINQISLRVPDLASLRTVRDRVKADPDVSDLVCTSHGNAVSIYFRDPEGNRLEVFLDMPWYCEQPLREDGHDAGLTVGVLAGAVDVRVAQHWRAVGPNSAAAPSG